MTSSVVRRKAQRLVRDASQILKANLPHATVSTFVSVLVSKLTQYDQRNSTRRGYNPYALAAYLNATDKILKETQARLRRQGFDASSDDPAALRVLDKVLDEERFLFKTLPPVKNVRRQIADFLEHGRMPTLTSRRPRSRVPRDPL